MGTTHWTTALLPLIAGAASQVLSNNTVRIPEEYTYLLPDGYTGDYNLTFVNGTSTSNDSINSLLNAASRSPFIAYSDEFLDILGDRPSFQLVQQREVDQAFYELGCWVPERNEVWITSAVQQSSTIPSRILALNLETNEVYPVDTSEPVIDPNGGYYWEGKVYVATYRNNETYRGSVVAIDVETLEVETVLNSYFGLRFNGIDDIVWVRQGNRAVMFFTDLDYADYLSDELPPLQLPAGVWRFDPHDKTVLPVISRNELNPNGVRVSPDQRTLYVTDSSSLENTGVASDSWLGPYIYSYRLDEDMFPVQRRVFSVVRQGIADGIHVDDAGRVWTGEYSGVVVRSPSGKLLGEFNSQFFQEDKGVEGLAVANFALAGDVLVFFSTTRLWIVKLGQTVVSEDSVIVNRNSGMVFDEISRGS